MMHSEADPTTFILEVNALIGALNSFWRRWFNGLLLAAADECKAKER